MLKNEKGMVLIVLYLVVGILMLVVGVFAYRNVIEIKATEKLKQGLYAFYSAEAAVDKAVAKLPASTTSESNVDLNDASGATIGEYTYSINILEVGKRWQVDAWGYYPDQANTVASSNVEAFVSKKDLASSFWENAIYTAGNVRINGTAYDLDGDLRYGGSLLPSVLDPANFSGTSYPDPTVSPLVKLDYDNMKTEAIGQIKADGSDNLYTAVEIASGNPPLPSSFWFDDSDADPSKWVPNVVYVESDLILNGDVGTIGGFLLVVGDVVTDPTSTSETIINGNGQIDGCIYSTGQFRVNGGGSGLNVLGGVWSGSDGVRINGSVTIEYEADYMNAIRDVIQPSSTVQVISWRRIQ